MTLIFTGWTIASAEYSLTKSQASSRAVIAFIFLYSPFYNMAYNALTYSEYNSYVVLLQFAYPHRSAYLVEVFPYHVRAKGITIFQWWGRCAGFFNQFVNPIGIGNAGMSICLHLSDKD